MKAALAAFNTIVPRAAYCRKFPLSLLFRRIISRDLWPRVISFGPALIALCRVPSATCSTTYRDPPTNFSKHRDLFWTVNRSGIEFPWKRVLPRKINRSIRRRRCKIAVELVKWHEFDQLDCLFRENCDVRGSWYVIWYQDRT